MCKWFLLSATQDLQGYKQGEKTPGDAIKGSEDKFLIQNRKMKPNVSPIASGPSDDMLCRLLNSHTEIRETDEKEE